MLKKYTVLTLLTFSSVIKTQDSFNMNAIKRYCESSSVWRNAVPAEVSYSPFKDAVKTGLKNGFLFGGAMFIGCARYNVRDAVEMGSLVGACIGGLVGAGCYIDNKLCKSPKAVTNEMISRLQKIDNSSITTSPTKLLGRSADIGIINATLAAIDQKLGRRATIDQSTLMQKFYATDVMYSSFLYNGSRSLNRTEVKRDHARGPMVREIVENARATMLKKHYAVASLVANQAHKLEN